MNAIPNDGRWRGTAVALLAMGHGLGDFNAGVLLAVLGAHSGADLVMLYLVYNALAFAGQPIAGLLCDRLGGKVEWFIAGGIMSAGSLVLTSINPLLAIVVSGVASAFYHSAGGAAAWIIGRQRVLAAGAFAAPGVLGLALGLGVGGQLHMGEALAGGIGLLVVLGALAGVVRRIAPVPRTDAVRCKIDVGLVGGVAGWLAILAIAARSFAWTLGQVAVFPAADAVRLALAAAVGKAVAGLVADRLGAARVAIFSLSGAAILLTMGSVPSTYIAAAALLQAGTGPMMALVLSAWPNHPTFASGLAQGLAVALGGAPLLAMGRLADAAPFAIAGALLAAAAVVIWITRTRIVVPKPALTKAAPAARSIPHSI